MNKSITAYLAALLVLVLILTVKGQSGKLLHVQDKFKQTSGPDTIRVVKGGGK